jgi:hypothetical protein
MNKKQLIVAWMLCFLFFYLTLNSSFAQEVTGIFYDDEEPYAIINGEVAKVGDAVGGRRIIEIKPDFVKFKYGDSVYEKRLTKKVSKTGASHTYRVGGSSNKEHFISGEWANPINQEQPISIGEKIYGNLEISRPRELWAYYYHITYSYLGVQGGNVKVKYEYGESVSTPSVASNEEKKEEGILLLPLNAQKQALLKTKQTGTMLSEELLITVVDEFNRIKVEKYERK